MKVISRSLWILVGIFICGIALVLAICGLALDYWAIHANNLQLALLVSLEAIVGIFICCIALCYWALHNKTLCDWVLHDNTLNNSKAKR